VTKLEGTAAFGFLPLADQAGAAQAS
jgi:hypothetical protein